MSRGIAPIIFWPIPWKMNSDRAEALEKINGYLKRRSITTGVMNHERLMDWQKYQTGCEALKNDLST